MSGPVGYQVWREPSCPVQFVVKNILPYKKTIRVFNYPIPNGFERDLMKINFISEADIKNSLLKGELYTKLRNQELFVTASNIDLIQFEECQKDFLMSVGITEGLEAGGDGYQGNFPYLFRQNTELQGTKDNLNRIFIVPFGDKFLNQNIHQQHFRILIRHNGKGLEEGIDYIVAESGGSGTGFNTIIFIAFSPAPSSRILADYVIIDD